MIGGGRVALVCGAAAAALLMGGLTARGASQCEPTMKITSTGTFSRACGPGQAIVRVGAKTYRIRPGGCERSLDRDKIPMLTISMGYLRSTFGGTPHGLSIDIFLSHYKGPGKYSTVNRAEINLTVGKKHLDSVKADPAYKKLGIYRGPGTVTVTSGERGGTFTVPIVDDVVTSGVSMRDVPTVHISGSFTCR
jgi:hypothetical protein